MTCVTHHSRWSRLKLNAELEFAASQVPMALTCGHHHFCNDIRCASARSLRRRNSAFLLRFIPLSMVCLLGAKPRSFKEGG